MKVLCLGLFGGVVLASGAENLASPYGHGELILTQLVSAPFPHPERAEGHRYKEEFFSAKEHYSDSTVGMFIPEGFRETGRIDFVVHFHGWRNGVTNVLRQYQLSEQLVESGRNAVLIVPQGPLNAADSFGGKLEDPDGFRRFMEEVTATLRGKSGLKKKDFTIGKIVLSGHSGGYHVMSSILDRGGLADKVEEVWLFDALYGEADKFRAWFDRGHGRLINLYTEHGGTKEETERMMAEFKERGTALYAGREGTPKLSELRTNRLVFLFTELAHDEVVNKHGSFGDFLKTSCLEERGGK